MHFKIFFLISCIGLLFFSFKSFSQTHTNDINNFVLNVPPNVIYIRDNFYCGQAEISNINYREYVYWMGKIYGKNSLNYLSSLPDTHIWNEFPHCFLILSEQYFVYPKFDDYPVVGISQQQAKEYCKWLSDRYFESLLIQEGILSMNPNQSNDSFFSIESYLSGTYHNMIPSKDIKYYPSFRLPNLMERGDILNFSKQCALKNSSRNKSYSIKKHKWTPNDIQSDITPCYTNEVPFVVISKKVKDRNKNSLFNLRGNVGEWLIENNLSAGGGWVDKREVILKQDSTTVMYPNAWTGFRVIFEWREWNN